jgi:hypothetical protein
MKRFSITHRELASSQCFRNNCDNEEHSSERLRKASNTSAVAVAVAACLFKADPTWLDNTIHCNNIQKDIKIAITEMKTS